MKKLIVNAGSSSLRVSVFQWDIELVSVTISWIWEDFAEECFQKGDIKDLKTVWIKNHSQAFESTYLSLKLKGIICHEDDIIAVAHRVVHGGEYFSESVIINNDVIQKIEICSELARLHNPINLECIRAAMSLLTQAKHIAVFDTAFHSTIPAVNYTYAIPKEYVEKYNIRKYGFHGASHKYMSERVVEISSRKLEKVITCHVWWWASICALRDGKSINTSMWLTPLDGLVMWTRSWDIDPWVILYLQEKQWISAEEMRNILNTQSWMLGLTGITWDIRTIQENIWNGSKICVQAMEIYISRIVRFIGWYIADLWGIDAIVFTGWVLQNDAMIRKTIAEKIACFWVEFDQSKNDFRSQERKISTESSEVELYVIPMQEELMMNRELKNFL